MAAMRNLCITILLALVVSNAMMGVHVATHMSAEPSECSLCTAYGDPTAVAASTGLSVSADVGPDVHSGTFQSFESSLAFISFRQRGPPAHI